MKARALNKAQRTLHADPPPPDPDATAPRVNDASPPVRARGLARLVDSLVKAARGEPAESRSQTPADKSAADDSPELLDLLLESPDALVVLHRKHGEIIEISDRFVEWSGRSRDSLLGTAFRDLFSEHEQKIVRTLYEDAGAGGVHVVELPSANADGRSWLVEFTSSKSNSGRGEFALLGGRDAAERAATERYLRSERDRLNTFIRSMRDSLVLLSPTGDILYSNPATDQMFETYELPVVCHRWLKEFSQNDRTDLQGLTSAYGGQTLTLTTGERTFLVTRSFLFEANGQAMVMLMAKDISEQTLIESQNRQLEIELIRESKLAEFGMLSAGIAHNLNGPLTGVLGLCELLELRGDGTKEIEQIREQAMVMREIIANLMQKSRSERETEPRDLIIEDIVITELRFLDANLFFKNQVTQEISLALDSPPIYGVYIDFSQVIGNLLRNAIDSMHDSEPRILTVHSESDEKFLTLKIGDTGSGMSDDVKKQLFKPFFTTKPKSQDAKPGEPAGTGLGLSSSRNMLARYGAAINFESAPGTGTTFTIRIPLDRQSQLLKRE